MISMLIRTVVAIAYSRRREDPVMLEIADIRLAERSNWHAYRSRPVQLESTYG